MRGEERFPEEFFCCVPLITLLKPLVTRWQRAVTMTAPVQSTVLMLEQ